MHNKLALLLGILWRVVKFMSFVSLGRRQRGGRTDRGAIIFQEKQSNHFHERRTGGTRQSKTVKPIFGVLSAVIFRKQDVPSPMTT